MTEHPPKMLGADHPRQGHYGTKCRIGLLHTTKCNEDQRRKCQFGTPKITAKNNFALGIFFLEVSA